MNVDQNVLEAIAHSLEFEVYSIESKKGRETVHGIRWTELQRITALADLALEQSTGRLALAGLINCGGTPYTILGWRLGRRTSAFFWVTPEGRRRIADHDRAVAAE